MRKSDLSVLLVLLLAPTLAWASPPSRTCTYTAGETISPTCVGGNEDEIFEYLQGGVDTIADNAVVSADILNGTIAAADIGSSAVTSASILDGDIVNADVNASAAIDFSKLGTLTSGNLLVGSAGGVATSVNPSGDVDVDNAGAFTIQTNSVALGTDTTNNYVATIADSGNANITVANSGSESAAVTLNVVDVTCTNCLGPTEIASLTTSDLSASAAITFAQLAALTDGNILVGNSSNVAASVNPSGDVDVSNAGAFTVQDNSVDGTDIAMGSDAQGDVYYYDGTNVVRLGAGTAGNVLKTGGAGANPSWIGAPMWQFVETLTFATESTKTSATLPTDADVFKIVLDGVNISGANTVLLQFNASVASYSSTVRSAAGFAAAASTAGITLIQGNDTNAHGVGECMFERLEVASNNHMGVMCSIYGPETVSTEYGIGGDWGAAADVTTITIVDTTAETLTGKFHLYKLSKQ